ncbi:Cu(I)-responsive transcriptional regulator [hydrothermal vent metagenome]|uniref:Cu(I)-responsive transcriptional regulator n=1 Tax=hydrothermal vent metagenome TaxID=652676 RepID=A0A3B0ZMY1_9ZZZZ
MALYRIGDVTKQFNVTADTLRYYEKIGLFPDVSRTAAGVRQYNDKDLSRLRFIKRAQYMNFSLNEIKDLLEMRSSPQTAKDNIRQLTALKLTAIEEQVNELTTLKNELTLLLNLCRGSENGCPIIDDLDGTI